MRKQFCLAGLVLVIWMVVDWLSLALLPVFGLSYGHPLPGWISFAMTRWATFVAWGMGWMMMQKRVGGQLLLRWLVFVQVLLTALVVYGFYIEPFQLTTGQVTIETDRLPAGQRLRIVHLSDLHMEYITVRERALIPLVQGLNADVIVWTGDYFNTSFGSDPVTWEHARQIVETLDAPMGVYAVNGSVEYVEHAQRLFDGITGARVLNDEAVALDVGGQRVWILGVSDIWRERDRQALRSLSMDLPEDEFRVLLYHSPDLMDVAIAQKMNLYLSGHTHGGQVRLPIYGALVTFSDFGKRYEMGMYEEFGTTLYVTRGLGMEGTVAPRVRFLAPPEVVVIDLIGTGQ